MRSKLFAPVDMTEGDPVIQIIKFTIPMLLGNIAQQLYNTVDSIIVGRFVGDNALATVIAQFVSAFLSLRRLTKMTEYFDMKKEYLVPDREYITSLIRLGIPSGVTQAIFSMSMIVVQSLTNSFGEQFIAANVIVMRIDGFVILPALSKTPELPQGNCAMMFVSMLISWTLGAVITLVMYKRGKWMEKAKLVLGN